jgi:hypothetical protein
MSKLIQPVAQLEETGNAETRSSSQRRQDVIRANVLAALGRPAELLRVSAHLLWGNKFRVNVWTSGSNGAEIPNSYFVTTDDSGTILRSEPPIQKQY